MPCGITPRRLSAAKRALKREQDRYALFAEQVMSEQESPEQRIARFDREAIDASQSLRDLAAKQWRKGRRLPQSAPSNVRCDILHRWNKSSIPPTAAYFADFVRRALRERKLFPSEDDA